jgi:hypothetical protein
MPPVEVIATPMMTDATARLSHLGKSAGLSRGLLAWLAQDDIIRRLTAAVNMVANGKDPRGVLGFLGPLGAFETVTRAGHVYTAPQSYERYDGFTHILTAVDVQVAVRTYHQMKPFVDAAFSEITSQQAPFEATLHEAIHKLTSSALPKEEPELYAKGALYAYADEKLEALSPAQKQLLRMGPKNAHAFQIWLQKLDHALGAPAFVTHRATAAPGHAG